jgi:hypothetical protein
MDRAPGQIHIAFRDIYLQLDLFLSGEREGESYDYQAG